VKPLRNRLEEIRRASPVAWEVLERDYALSWILAGIARTPELQGLVFKGGTALKKCYFGGYRFSEDLDFSALRHAPAGQALEQALGRAGEAAVRLASPYAQLAVELQRYQEREPHPAGQEAFTFRLGLPWHRGQLRTRVLVEITRDEILQWPPLLRPILHAYGEDLDNVEISAYAVEEIVAEKLRALLQQTARLRSRGWTRSRARDIYDLWRLLSRAQPMDSGAFVQRLRAKCVPKGVEFAGAADFLQPDLLEQVRKTWQDWLGPLVAPLPDLDLVLGELRPRLEALLLEPDLATGPAAGGPPSAPDLGDDPAT